MLFELIIRDSELKKVSKLCGAPHISFPGIAFRSLQLGPEVLPAVKRVDE